MNLKKIIVIIGIIFIAGLVAFSKLSEKNSDQIKNAKTSRYSAAALSALEREFDFGKILMKNGKVSHNFALKNEGEETIKIEKIYTSCMCTEAGVIDESGKKYGPFGMPGHGGLSSKTDIKVEAGKSVVIEAIFDPAAHGPQGVGPLKRFIYIETNSRLNPLIQLSFEANVTL